MDIEEGRRVLKIEAQAILDVAEKLNGAFEKSVALVLAYRLFDVVLVRARRAGTLALS